MEKVYVIYKNNEIYKSTTHKNAYFQARFANSVITSLSKDTVKGKIGWTSWVNISDEERNKLIEQEKRNYTVRIFIDSGETC